VQSCFLTGDAEGAGWPTATVAKPLRLSCVQLGWAPAGALPGREPCLCIRSRERPARSPWRKRHTPFLRWPARGSSRSESSRFRQGASPGTVFPLTE